MAKLARASSLQFLSNIALTVVGGLVTIYLVRELGVDAFGKYVLATAIISWIRMPFAGIRGATTKRMSEQVNQAAFFTAGLVLALIALVVLSLGLIVARPYVNDYVGFEATFLIVTLFVSLVLFYFFLGGIRGYDRVELSTLLEGSRHITQSAFQAAFVLLGVGVTGLLWGSIVATAALLVVGVLYVRPHLQMPSGEEFKSLWNYSKYSWLSAFRANSYSWMDTFLLGFFVTSELVGTYEIAWRLSALFILLPSAMSRTSFPTISSLATEDKIETVEQILCRMLSLSTLLAIPGLVGTVVIGRDVLSIYGDSVTAVGPALAILALLSAGRIVEGFEVILNQVLNALDYPERTFRVSVVFTITNIGLNLVLINLIGVIGAAIATSFSILLSAILCYRALPEEISLRLNLQTLTAQIVGATVMGSALLIVTGKIPPESEIEVIVYVLLGALVYATIVVSLSEEIRQRVRQLTAETISVF